VKSIVLQCIRKHLGELTNVDLESSLVDLGYDSMKFIELVVIIEQRFSIEFADEDLNYRRFGHVSDLLAYVENRCAATVVRKVPG
jgi:acyl carrier protein